MTEGVLIVLSLIIGIASILTIIARSIKLPPIIAYLIAGIIAGPLVLNLTGPTSSNAELIRIFAHLGVALLLFIVGLSLDFKVLKEVGKVSSTVGFIEIIFSALIGFLIALALNFQIITAMYIGLAIAFSSTVIVVKILSDKREMDTLHARVAIGILIIEDFVAILVLVAIPSIGQASFLSIFLTLMKVILLIAVVFVFSHFTIKKALGYIARNQEVLFLFGIAWALIVSALFNMFELSLEIGALVAGMALASSRYNFELSGKIKPLRDFFVVILFIFFGSQLESAISLSLLKTALIFSFFILVGKPLIVMTIMRIMGYTKRTNFLTGTSIAQVSEFSLILILIGNNLGHVSKEIMSLIVLISLITIGFSSYSLYYSHHIFNKIAKYINFLEGKRYKEQDKKDKEFDVFLFGYNRIGYNLLESLSKLNLSYLVIDYNPRVILELSKKGIPCIYGDATDREFLEELQLSQAKIVLSTIPGESNLVIKKRLKEMKSKAIFIATSEQIHEAIDLYDEGVDYVIIPHLLGGKYSSHMLEHNKIDAEKYKKAGKEHYTELLKRLKEL